MDGEDTQSLDFKSLKQGKPTKSNTQLKTIFEYLQNHTVTASMLAEATGIPQKSICRYKRDLERKELLCELEKKLCLQTNFKAWFLTTNPKLFPKKRCSQDDKDNIHNEGVNQFI